MTKRRGKGEGSIYRRKDGSWVAQYMAGSKRRYIYGSTRKEVAARLSKALAERDSGIVYDSENLKVADYLDRWLDSKRGTLRERTWRRHEEITRLHLKPSIGGAKLDKLNALQFPGSLPLEARRWTLAAHRADRPRDVVQGYEAGREVVPHPSECVRCSRTSTGT